MERIEFEVWSAREVARLLSLIDSERRYYQELIAALPVPLAVVNRNHNLLSVNRAFRKAIQVRHADIIQKRLEDFDAISHLAPVVEEALGSGSARTAELMAGGSFWQATVTPLPSSDNGYDALLLLEAAKTAAAPERVWGVVWTLNLETGAVTVKQAPPGWATGEWAARVHPEDAERVRAAYQRAVESQRGLAVEYRSPGVPARWLCDLVEPKGPELHGLTLDVTERRLDSQWEAQREKDAALRRAGARIAHTLNNALMVVNGYAEDLRETLEAGEGRESAEQILGAAERMANLAAELLEFSRPPGFRPEAIDVADLVSRAGLGVPVTGGGQVSIAADPALLAEALRTIVDVAGASQSGARLEIGQEQQLSDFGGMEPGLRAVLRLGPLVGMNPREWSEPLLEKSHRRSLAAPVALVNQMGGLVSLEPLLEGKATLAIRFPAVEKGVRVEAPAARPAPPAQHLETVLVVDDEPSICELITRILTRQGYRVLQAKSGEEALRAVAAHAGRIEAVVSDVALPGMPGTELVARLRESYPGMRVLYISGYTDDEAIRSGELGAGEGFLQKPFTLSALVAKVRTLLDTPAR